MSILTSIWTISSLIFVLEVTKTQQQQYGNRNPYFNNQPSYGGYYPQQQNYHQIPQISCPQYFSYQKDPSLGGIFGLIVTPQGKFDKEFDLEVNMTIKKEIPQESNIKLSVVSTQDQIFKGDPIKWGVKFPDQDMLPKLTQIKYNGVVICSNPPDPLVAGVPQTAMWAKAVLKVSTVEETSRPTTQPPYPQGGHWGNPYQPYQQGSGHTNHGR